MLSLRVIVHSATLEFLFDRVLKSIAFENNGLYFLFVCPVFAVIFFNNHLVFNEVLFILLVDNTSLLLFRSLTQNIYGLLPLALGQDSSGTPPLSRFPVTDMLANP